MVQEAWIEIARSLGLSEYEARAYVGLLEFGEATAGEISKASRVPRGRVYGILEALQAKGLVSLAATAPQRYRPAPMDAFLDQRRRELRDREAELGRTAETLAKIPLRRRATPIATGDFLLYRKRGAVMAKIRAMLDSASHEILIVASEGWALRTSKLLLRSLREKAEKGVDIRSCVNITPNNLAAVQSLSPFVRTRHNTLGNQVMSIAVIDKSQAFVCHWNPDDESPFFGDDVAVWSDDPGLVKAFHAIALETWSRGIEDVIRYRELETGERPGTTAFFTDVQGVQAEVYARGKEATTELWTSTPNSMVEEQPENYVAFFGSLPLKDLDARLLVAYDGGSLRGVESLARLGMETRISTSHTVGRQVIFDGRHALSFLWPGSAWTSAAGSSPAKRRVRDILVSTDVRSAVDAHVSAYEFEWERATPVADFRVPAAVEAAPMGPETPEARVTRAGTRWSRSRVIPRPLQLPGGADERLCPSAHLVRT